MKNPNRKRKDFLDYSNKINKEKIMKKKITVFLSIIMAFIIAFSLAACKDNTGGGGGGLPPGGGGDVAPITSVTTVNGAYQCFLNIKRTERLPC